MKKAWLLVILLPMLLFFSGCQEPVEEQRFTEEDALALEADFENALIQETVPREDVDPEPIESEPIVLNTRVRDFDDKESLVDYLQNYMSEGLALQYTDLYYEERDGDLYLIPMDGPILIIEEEPVIITELDDGRYELTQTVDSEFIGLYTLRITYEQRDGDWIIVERVVES